jgi:hypothetical protein
MTIAIDDISTTEQLDREALTGVRGGILHIVAPSPWRGCPPRMPAFPNCFPFNGDSPFPQPAHVALTDPENPSLQ